MTLTLHDEDLKREYRGAPHDDIMFSMFKENIQELIVKVNELGGDSLFQSNHGNSGPKLIALS